MAARAFSLTRRTRRMSRSQLDELARDEQRRNGVSAAQAMRIVRMVRQLDRIDIDRDDGTSFASCNDIGGETVETDIPEKNVLLRSTKIARDRIDHFDMVGNFCGRTIIDSDERHIHFADHNERLMIGEDIFDATGADHYARRRNESSRFVGRSNVRASVDETAIQTAQAIEQELNYLAEYYSREEYNSGVKGIRTRDRCASNPSSCGFMDH